MAFTTLPTLFAGMVLTGDHLTSIETAITEIRPIGAVKTADQTNTTTTIADDTELQIALAASTNYEGHCHLIANIPAAGDIKLQFSVPSGCTGYWNPPVQNLAAGAGTVYQGALPIATQAQLEGQGADEYFHIRFAIVTTNAGTFKVQHALNTASGTLTIKAASILVARRII
jgi:hypothetical protein